MKKSEIQKENEKTLATRKTEDEDFLIVGIGASAGGVQALKEFFANVPAESGAAYVVILHLSPDFESQLPEILQKIARIPVERVEEQVRVEANHVYVISPNESLSMRDGFIVVSPVNTVEERRAPVDIFFRTLADSHDGRSVAVVLSGTGANGSMGIKRIKEKGGAAFVQNPQEAEFGEMPRNSIATELVDEVLNVAEIPAKIIAYQKNLGKIVIPVEPELREEKQQKALREIFTSLRVRTGHDFANYKRATVLRRIERRINVRELSDLTEYAAYLKEKPDEIQALLKDLLISVTNFFRDKEAFLYLERDVLPRILTDKKSGDEIRLWVAGCATGEEAYSIAMMLAEQIEHLPSTPTVQIFATDIDTDAVAAARNGFYTLNDAADVSPERLKRFFTKEKNGYRIRRELREMILFANHNLLKDPPFSKLDLVTCRNLLIYFNRTAQGRVLETMHFALKPGGYLFLGSSESIDGAGDLYSAFNREERIFQSRQISPRIAYPVPDLSPSLHYDKSANSERRESENRPFERISYGDLHGRILEQFAPPSIIVNEQYDVVHVSENAGRFLQISGELSPNLFKLIQPELLLPVSTAVYQAVQNKANVVAENLQFHNGEQTETINVSVRPVLRQTGEAEGFILILFAPAEDLPDAPDTETISLTSTPADRRLEEELLRSQSRFQTSIEHSEIQAEELKASNEELQAINEELRSTTEELETGKEELQSVNEELVTVNQELKIKIEELSNSNNDLQNLINSTNIGTIFLDRNFRVKFFTPVAGEIFNLIPADSGRLLSDITHKLEGEDLNINVERVLSDLQPVEREVRTSDGNFYLMQITPYRTSEDHIGGTIITFVNITKSKQQAEKLRHTLAHLKLATDATRAGWGFWDFLTGAAEWDERGKQIIGFADDEESKTAQGWLNRIHPQDLPSVEAHTAECLEQNKDFNLEYRIIRADGRTRLIHAMGRFIKTGDGTPLTGTGLVIDITENKQADEQLRRSEERLQMAMEAGQVIWWEMDPETQDYSYSGNIESVIGFTLPAQIIKNPENHIHPEDRKRATEKAAHAAKTGEPYEDTIRFINPHTGKTVWLHSKGSVVKTTDGRNRFVGVAQNITERKQGEEDLRESEKQLRLIIKSVEDYAIIATDLEGNINGWNPGAEKMFGYAEQDVLGKPTAIIFTPEDRENGVPEQEMTKAAEKGRAEDERWHIRKDGSRFYVSGVMQPIKDGKIDGFVKIARDLTEQIKAERTMRDKEMLQKLVNAQEDERKRIARDLHDELGQLLTALRLQLEAVRKLCDEDELCGKVDEAQLTAKHLDAGIDFLAWELRPAALDDFGLYAALTKYIREWSRYSGVAAELLDSGLKKTRFIPEVETNLYRIAQEALNNVYKHAEAERVEVVFDKREDLIVLIIEDNGIGFEIKDKLNRSKGIGLLGMEERASLIGGTLEIESAPGKGTTVFIRVPASNLEKELTGDE